MIVFIRFQQELDPPLAERIVKEGNSIIIISSGSPEISPQIGDSKMGELFRTSEDIKLCLFHPITIPFSVDVFNSLLLKK